MDRFFGSLCKRLTTTAARSSALGVSGRASASGGGRLAWDDDLGGLLACVLARLLADWLALENGGRGLAGVHARGLALVLAVVLLLEDDDLLLVAAVSGARVGALGLALRVTLLDADWSWAGGLALVGARVGAGVSLLGDDHDWGLVGGAAGRAGWHALWLAGWLAGLLAGRLARLDADWGGARAGALVVAVGGARVVLLDDDDLLVVVVVSAGWSASRLTVAGWAGLLAGRLAGSALVLLWLENDDLWGGVSARAGALVVAGLGAHWGGARADALLLALVAGAGLWEKDDLLVSTALLVTGWLTLLHTLNGLAGRLALLETDWDALHIVVVVATARVRAGRTALTLGTRQRQSGLVLSGLFVGEDEGAGERQHGDEKDRCCSAGCHLKQAQKG